MIEDSRKLDDILYLQSTYSILNTYD